MRQRILIIEFSSGSLAFVADFLLWANQWVKENDLSNARVEQTKHGYRIWAESAWQAIENPQK